MEIHEPRVESRESRAKYWLPETSGSRPSTPGLRRSFGPRPSSLDSRPAFTLIELLVVIAILGIMAALTVPVLKNFAKSDATLGASRQLLDGVARARQMAISQHTTVYMVFVPTNFWAASGSSWFNALTLAQKTAATNLCDKQLTGFTFIAHGAMGDQPGQHSWHYLDPWQTLPDGTFIAFQKFYTTNTITDQVSGAAYPISTFNYTNDIPFPTVTSTSTNGPYLPYIAFNYMGQLTFDEQNIAPRDEYIPIAKGSVIYAADAGTKRYQFNPADVAEIPPGNSTNSSYNIVHIDRLTGRAVLEYQKLQ